MDEVRPQDPAISSLIGAAERGDSTAAGKLFDILYAELHRMARRELGNMLDEFLFPEKFFSIHFERNVL